MSRQVSKNVKKTSVRTGQQPKAKVVAGVAQYGQAQGNHVTEQGSTGYGGVSSFGGTGFPTKHGNTVAVETVCGPGGSRTVHKSGSQSGLAQPTAAKTGREII
jgi:hypothetical protein